MDVLRYITQMRSGRFLFGNFLPDVEFMHEGDQLLRELSHISFPQLTILQLCGCNISSVEMVARMDVPNLKRFSISNPLYYCLGNNKVYSLRTVRKCRWLKVMSVSISNFCPYVGDNFICDPEHLCSLPSSFTSLSIGHAEENASKNMTQIQWTHKLKSSSLKKLSKYEVEFRNSGRGEDMVPAW